ncbi:hypothetical protein PAXRUDRAFT_157858 [Paxillus rubicundulus Ve08.2h10]|uniref:JmjC domain-containing protein n=1 Tax=Paxillus rubicundulus Ve08.2h10 TaxID=930991 RepID=A0A0D0CDE3_9AGAM|nr:hypothetical protein PAXRUDRAFT_157858 [Paxillus rubicundulus Ve08.2h10]
MHFDTWCSSSWDIFTHAGFLTYPHHNASRLATYSYICSGAKIWAYMHLDKVDEHDQKDIFAKWFNYYHDTMVTETYDQNVKVGTVFLEKGAVLIQPPGANHMVYTPVHSIMSGGHFLCYDSMHITEMSLSFNFGLDNNNETRHHASNSIHPGMLRKVYCMAIALPHLVHSRSKPTEM